MYAWRLELQKAEVELMERAFQRMGRWKDKSKGVENSLSAEGRTRKGCEVRRCIIDDGR